MTPDSDRIAFLSQSTGLLLWGRLMTKLSDLLHFEQHFKAKIAHILGNFCKVVKIFHFASLIILGNFYWHLATVYWSHCSWLRGHITGYLMDNFSHLFATRLHWFLKINEKEAGYGPFKARLNTSLVLKLREIDFGSIFEDKMLLPALGFSIYKGPSLATMTSRSRNFSHPSSVFGHSFSLTLTLSSPIVGSIFFASCAYILRLEIGSFNWQFSPNFCSMDSNCRPPVLEAATLPTAFKPKRLECLLTPFSFLFHIRYILRLYYFDFFVLISLPANTTLCHSSPTLSELCSYFPCQVSVILTEQKSSREKGCFVFGTPMMR